MTDNDKKIDNSNSNSNSNSSGSGRGSMKLIALLALVGAVGIALALYGRAAQRGGAMPGVIAADETIDQVMQATYGKYADSAEGWMYVADNRQTFAMRVVHRAKIVDAAGHEALYFVASSTAEPTRGASPIVGVFKVVADLKKKDGSLIQISHPFLPDIGNVALTPESIRFEALSHKTFGWVFKAKSEWRSKNEEATGTIVWNVVVAPSDDSMAVVARFPASKQITVAGGCAKAQSRYTDYRASVSTRRVPAMPSAASAAADTEPESEDDTDIDEETPMRCSDASFTYTTEPVPGGGFVNFIVTGGGQIDGVVRAEETKKLVFDPKSFTYRVPPELQDF